MSADKRHRLTRNKQKGIDVILKKNKKWKIAALFLGAVLMLQNAFLPKAAMAQENLQPTLEKSARWTDAASYEAEIQLNLKKIKEITSLQPSVGVIAMLDVTDSMQACETEGHVHKVSFHTLDAFENSSQVWEKIKETLPDQETYARMGEAGTENLFLKLPEEIDPQQRCRLVCRYTETGNSYPQDNPRGWRVVYTTEDQSLLPGVRADAPVFSWYHCIRREEGIFPVGEMEILKDRTVWKDTERKTEAFGCQESRMDQLVEGYNRFLETLFENQGAKVCPVAFHGGYYMGGWTESLEEAKAFLAEQKYLEAEAVMPQNPTGTNHEAAVLGALDAINRLEDTQNVFALLFTDGSTTSGYSHQTGSPDTGCLDPHSYGQEEYDASYQTAFAQWAIEDAAILKEKVPVYGVGYGYSMKMDHYSQNTVEQISSGEEYFIDTKEQNLDNIMEIFRAVCSDMILKSVPMKVVDYISEYWLTDVQALPLDWKVEEIPITNQKNEEDIIQKLTIPVTRTMGEDDQETFRIPVTLREAYRNVETPVWYETNQDEPFEKGENGCGAYAVYQPAEQELKIEAETPRLDVYPQKADFTIEKKALQEQVKAGEKAAYEITATNLSQQTLNEIQVEDVFESTGWRAEFGACEGVRLEEEDTKAVIGKLERGESKVLTAYIQIPEEQKSEVLINTAQAKAVNPQNPGEILERKAQARTEITELKTDFEVEKTADKEEAKPGEEIVYTIRIQNTGERTLHSVLAVDQFLNQGVKAAFREQEGIQLSQEKDQAVIPQILSGETVTLEASVVIPENFKNTELINMAIVSTEDQSLKKEAEETVKIQQGTAKTPTPSAKSQTQTPGNYAKGVSDQPKTGDNTRTREWKTALLLAGLGCLTAGFGLLIKKKN